MSADGTARSDRRGEALFHVKVGDGSGADQHKPVEILPADVIGVAAGNFFSIALV